MVSSMIYVQFLCLQCTNPLSHNCVVHSLLIVLLKPALSCPFFKFFSNFTSLYLFTLYVTVYVYSLLTAISSLALPAVPSASIVAIIMVLTSLSIPVQAVSLLFAMEWFLWVFKEEKTKCSNLLIKLNDIYVSSHKFDIWGLKIKYNIPKIFFNSSY